MKNNGKNDLEIICSRCIEYCKDKKDSLVLYLLLIILAVVLIFFGMTFFKKNNSISQEQLDQAFRASETGSAIALPVAPDPAPFEAIRASKIDKEAKTDLDLAEADLLLQRGIFDLQANIANLNSEPGTNDKDGKKEAQPVKADPGQSFDKAISLYKTVLTESIDSIQKARALYSIGIVKEYFASIAKTPEDVKKNLDEATSYYKQVTEKDNPYFKPSNGRLTELAKPAINEYYKKTAVKYLDSLKPKKDVSILPNGPNKSLVPEKAGDSEKALDEFSIKADAPKADTKKEAK